MASTKKPRPTPHWVTPQSAVTKNIKPMEPAESVNALLPKPEPPEVEPEPEPEEEDPQWTRYDRQHPPLDTVVQLRRSGAVLGRPAIYRGHNGSWELVQPIGHQGRYRRAGWADPEADDLWAEWRPRS